MQIADFSDLQTCSTEFTANSVLVYCWLIPWSAVYAAAYNALCRHVLLMKFYRLKTRTCFWDVDLMTFIKFGQEV